MTPVTTPRSRSARNSENGTSTTGTVKRARSTPTVEARRVKAIAETIRSRRWDHWPENACAPIEAPAPARTRTLGLAGDSQEVVKGISAQEHGNANPWYMSAL